MFTSSAPCRKDQFADYDFLQNLVGQETQSDPGQEWKVRTLTRATSLSHIMTSNIQFASFRKWNSCAFRVRRKKLQNDQEVSMCAYCAVSVAIVIG